MLNNVDLKKDKQIVADISAILMDVYTAMGGHRQFTSTDPIGNDDAYVIDADGDGHVDAVILTDKGIGGVKIHGMGTNGNQLAKRMMMQQIKKLLSIKGMYTEISGRPAEILLSMGVKPINDPVKIEKIVTRDPKVEFEWLGDGWYARTFGGGRWMKKIMVGKPI